MISCIRNSLVLLLFLSLGNVVRAQDTLRYLDFLEMVKDYHPTAQNADLTSQQGILTERSARGGFDPKIKSDYKEKFFQDKFYYRVFDAKLVVPTITGIDIEAGYGNNDGKFLNAENFTPVGGTGYIGVNIPLGKGLFIDENRAQLRLAQQQRSQQEALGKLALNDLLLEASVSYWEWYRAVNVSKNQEDAIQLSAERLEMVRQEFYTGESPALDTLKAYVQYQERVLNYLSAKQLEVNAHWMLMTYFWDGQNYLKTDVLPENPKSISNNPFGADSDFWNNHPALVYYMTKFKSYDIERRLKAEKLKPKIDFEYKHLYNQVFPTFDNLGNSQYWGFNFAFPLFLTRERNDLKLSKLKIQQAQNDYDLKQRQLETKLKAYEVEFKLIEEQLLAQSVTVASYDDLIVAETIKYRIGESSLFELNSWEQKMISGQNKLYRLKAKQNLISAKIAWVLVSWPNWP